MADGNVPQQAPKLDALQLLKQLERSLLNVYEQAKKTSSNLKQAISKIDDLEQEEYAENLSKISKEYIEQTDALEKRAEKSIQKIRTDIERFSQLVPEKQKELTKAYLENTEQVEQTSESLSGISEHLDEVGTFFEKKSIEASNNYRFSDSHDLKNLAESTNETKTALEDFEKRRKETAKERFPYLSLIKSNEFFDPAPNESNPEEPARDEAENTPSPGDDAIQIESTKTEQTSGQAEQKPIKQQIPGKQKIPEFIPYGMPGAPDRDPVEEAELELGSIATNEKVYRQQLEPLERRLATALQKDDSEKIVKSLQKELIDLKKRSPDAIASENAATYAALLEVYKKRGETDERLAGINKVLTYYREATNRHKESSQIEDALAALKKNRVQPPVTTTQDTVAKEIPPETKKEEPSQPDSAAIASAIQDTLGRIPSQGETMDASIETSGRKTPRVTTPQKQKTISETRSELRKTHAVQQHETEILKLYGERMRTRSLEYLQTHDSARYTQIQQAQAQLGTTTTIDATVFLQTSELQAVHLLALTDVRATFSDATDEFLSRLLLAQAAQQIATAGIASQGAQILAGQAAAATLGAATMGALAATGMATAGLASAILTKADQTRQALQQEEENLGKRASQLRAASRSTATANTDARAGTPNLATLRAEQQAGSNTRRHLQADLHRQMQSATMANGLNDIATTRGPGATSTSQQEAAAGVLDLLSERVGEPRPGTFSRSGGGSSFGKKESSSSSEGARKTASGGTRKEAADASTSDASRAAHEANLASRLQAGKLRDQRIAEIEQTEVGSSRSMGGSSSGGTSDQLISSQGTRRRPASSTEVFAQKQQAMTARSQAFLGVGATAGGFEAAFADASVDDRDQVIEVQDDDLLPLEEAASEQAATEEQRAAEFQAEQQRDRQSNQNAQNKQSALDTLQKGKNLLDKKTIAQNSKFLLNPYVIAGIVVVLFFWLNIRLFFSNEESSWRQPLSGWGKIGTVVFDLALILSFLISFLLMASTVLLPLLPALLAIGGVSATISNITH